MIKYGLVIAVALAAPSVVSAGDYKSLYATNCSGCHGADGSGGGARGLRDPVFLRIADDATLRRVIASGVPGTAMPAFSIKAGGDLTDAQIDAIVNGIRTHWAHTATVTDVEPPPYSPATAGEPSRGGEAFATFCARCHGPHGSGGQGASSIVDPAYLALVSNQSLRTTVIAGRPDLGAPDWRGNVPGRPMSAADVADVVAWLAAKRIQ